jgi:WD40 repeat protein
MLSPQVKDVAISPDNSKFASVGGDRVFFLWDVGTSRIVRKFSGHSFAINCVAFSTVCRFVRLLVGYLCWLPWW